MKPAMTPQQEYLAKLGGKSPFSLYREIAVGNISIPGLAYYELMQLLFAGMPGLVGFGARALLYPRMFRSCGRRPGLGRGMVIRRPSQISLGKRLVCDDYSVLDVRGDRGSIEIGDYVSIGRFTTIAAKDGEIIIGNGVNIGSYCRVATQSKLTIEESALIAGYCYIGPGNHQQGDDDTPLIAREMEIRGGVTLGKQSWLGTRVTVADGVNIGQGSIIAAHSFVKDNIPPFVIAAGTPAKVIREIKPSA